MTTSLSPFIAEKSKILRDAGIDQAEAEVEMILSHLLNVGRMELVLHGAERLTEAMRNEIDRIIARRVTREPLQHILGSCWFFGRRFIVGPAVMVPAPETELLCEAAVAFVQKRALRDPRVLDIGVGSGVITLTVACELNVGRYVALDISPEAIQIARENAERLGQSDRVEFRESNLFSSIGAEEQFDLILSNPPYIAEHEYAGLPPEVLADPKISLTSGVEGMDAISEIVSKAPGFLASGGRIMFEIGYDQAEKVAALTGRDGRYRSISILKDLANLDRIVILSCD